MFCSVALYANPAHNWTNALPLTSATLPPRSYLADVACALVVVLLLLYTTQPLVMQTSAILLQSTTSSLRAHVDRCARQISAVSGVLETSDERCVCLVDFCEHQSQSFAVRARSSSSSSSDARARACVRVRGAPASASLLTHRPSLHPSLPPRIDDGSTNHARTRARTRTGGGPSLLACTSRRSL